MSLFEEQIYARKQQDDEVLNNAFQKNIDAVTSSNGKESVQKSVADTILWFFKMKDEENSNNGSSVEEILQVMDAKGILYRNVTLDNKWFRDTIGPMMVQRISTDKPVALIPAPLGGYRFYDENCDRWIHVNSKTDKDLSRNAMYFYKPLPNKSINIFDLVWYCFESLQISDIVFLLILMLLSTLLGLLTPKLQYFLMSTVIEQGSLSLLASTLFFMFCLSLTMAILSIMMTLFKSRIQDKMNINLDAAVMARLLMFSPSFFKQYSSGETATRMGYVNQLASNMINNVILGTISSLFSFAYITQVQAFAPELLWPAIIVTLVSILFNMISSLYSVRINRKTMSLAAKESGLLYSLINGIQKVKISGSEKRFFANWAQVLGEKSKHLYDPPMFLKGKGAFTILISLLGSFWIYFVAAVSQVSVAEYYAFNSAFGSLSGAITALVSIFTLIATIKPTVEMAKPIMETVPEQFVGKKPVAKVKGDIEFSHVCFRYSENMPYVLDDFSLKISSGEYVAVVGPTGCGKSTLVRLLLGFEKPERGAVYVDNNNLDTLEMTSYRRHIGTVTQDGMLFPGDIFSNIIISSPLLTLDDAWKAAETAQISDDIRDMPMDMHTIISEGSGGISGGQKQRLMIARAIAHRPNIIILDEATSALDNITQKKISKALDSLNSTRLVIAHRLSTIINCDRILYMENGKIVEEGTYDQLIESGGGFCELVKRQRIEET